MRVLIVDDDSVVRNSIRLYLEDCSHEVLEAADGLDGLEAMLRDSPDVALVDLRMPHMDGLELLKEVARHELAIPIIVVSGTGEMQDAVESLRRGAWEFVTKPIHDMGVLDHAIHRTMERKELLAERERHQQHLEREVRYRTEELMHANERLKSEVAERLCAELELKEAMEEVKAANAAKTTFLSNMSHELRTPLNSIIGLTDMVLVSEEEEDVMEYIGLVNLAGRELLSIVNNLLDLSAIEAGKVDLRESDFSLRKTIEDLMETFVPQAGWKNISMTYSIAPNTPDSLRGDDSRLRQILSNLLIRSIKNLETGAVELAISPEQTQRGQGYAPDGRDAVRLHFSISETGRNGQATSGQRGPEGRERNRETANLEGLGLSISKELIVMMEGDLWVDNDTTVNFTTLFRQSDSRQSAGAPVRSMLPSIRGVDKPLSILVAEDDPINQKLTEHFFESMGHRVSVVNNGVAVLELLNRERFDIIIMDIQMPDMDGLTTTRAIRNGETGDENRTIPIVAMTAHAMKGDRERFLRAGMDDYLAKPVELESLVRAVERALHLKTSR